MILLFCFIFFLIPALSMFFVLMVMGMKMVASREYRNKILNIKEDK